MKPRARARVFQARHVVRVAPVSRKREDGGDGGDDEEPAGWVGSGKGQRARARRVELANVEARKDQTRQT